MGTNPVASLAALWRERAVSMSPGVKEAYEQCADELLGRGVQYAPREPVHSGPRSQDCPACQEMANAPFADYPAAPPREPPPESRSPYDGMVDFTPETALRWALDYIADGSDETPPHVCEFVTNPPKGACDFHERYWAAREILEWLRGRLEGPSAPPPDETDLLAQDIRAIDGNHTLGAGALADALIQHGWTHRGDFGSRTPDSQESPQ